MPEQIEDEINQAISLIGRMYDILDSNIRLNMSIRPEDSIGIGKTMRDAGAERALQNVLDRRGVEYRINEGDGAFMDRKLTFISSMR